MSASVTGLASATIGRPITMVDTAAKITFNALGIVSIQFLSYQERSTGHESVPCPHPLVKGAEIGGGAMLDACRPARQSASGALCDRRKSPDFDITGTLAENTASLRAVPETMARRGLKASPLTGSVFERERAQARSLACL